MFTKRIIPCLDVNKGRVVKGVNFVDLKDAGDPVEIAKAYDAAGADELVFLDITKLTPLTTRPLLTSRQGMILLVNISVPLLFQFRKIFQDLEAVSAALLRMELACKYISLFNRCMDCCAVVCHCLYDLRFFCMQIIGMYKIYICVLWNLSGTAAAF